MISAVVAHRYAQAIYQAGVDAGQTEQVYTQLQFFAALLEQNVRLRELIMGKSLAAAQKKELIATIFANEKLPLVKHLLFILVDKGRETLLPDIIALYHQYQEQAAGRVEAQLVSVRPLTQAQISAV
ncbi:MAG: ATP synthase F1 subunit delta, partial [Clostridiales bacterium]